MQYIIKRDGRKKKFDSGKIKSALLKAMVAARNNDPQDNELEATNLTQKIVSKCYDTYKDTNPTVEQIQDIVVSTLIESGIVDVSKAYILYREERSQHRDSQTALMKKIEDITFSDAKESNLKRDNANVDGNTAMGTMLQYGSTVSKQFATDRLLNPEFRNEFLKGNIYPHDLDFMPMGTETCLSGYTVITVKGADDSVRDIKIKELDHFFNGTGDKQEIAYLDNLFILGRRGWTKFINVSRHRRAEKEKYYFIKTLNGVGLRATGEHRIPVIRNEEEVLLPVKEIVVGDNVYLINKDLEVPEIHYLRDETTDVIEINDEGYVYDIETEEHWFIANGYLVHNCLQLPLDKLFKDGFNTGHGTLREPQSIASYASLTAIALQANQNDQHGGQSIPLLDFYLAPGVSKSYLKNIKNNLKIILGFMDDDKDIESVFKEINEKDPDLLKLKNKDKLIEKLSSYFNNEKMCRKAVEEAILQVDEQTYQAMEGLVHNLNTMHCLPYKEKIWVYDLLEQDLMLMSVGELNDIFEEHRFFAISLNKETLNAELKKITAIQRKDNHRRLITLTTKAGQKITTTDNHKILSYDKENKNVVDMLPEDISYLLTPNGIDMETVFEDLLGDCSAEAFEEKINKILVNFGTLKDIEIFDAKLFGVKASRKKESNSGEEYVYDLSVEDNENFLTKDFIFVHNSRAGAQVPFSSINFGMDTSEEGRMVSKNLMLAQEAGLGNGETPIFPILIFQVKEGVNYNPEDPNYDLFKLSMRVSSKRLFPNFVFVDAPYNLQYYDPKDPETIISTMGCVDETEVITYMYKGHVRVESFGRAWKRISKDNEAQTFGDSEYFDLNDVKIFDSLTNEFVDCYKMLRNKDAGNWYKITFANGRQLIATGDHPLPLVNKGRTYVKDLERGDSVYANYKQCSEEAYSMSKEDAYLLGAVLRNASYRKTIHITVKQEREIEDILKDCLRKYTKDEIIINSIERENGELYYEISVNDPELSEEFCNVFEGVDKTERIIPNLLFEVEDKIRTAFLAGVVDASGDIYDDGKVEFSGNNRELLLQLMLFIQSTGVPAKFREVRRTKNKKEFVVSFRMPKELCELEIGSPIRKRINGVEPAIPATAVEITNIEYIGFRNRMSYDVETASDYFDVSGILSHNCRTRVIGNVNGKQSPVGRGNLSFTTINLPRLGIEYGVQYRQAGHVGYDREGFYKELDHMIDLAIDQLLDRLEIQKHKKVKNFPFLMGQGLWKGSEKLGANDEIGDILNEGTLSVGFIGLAECLEGLIQQHHGETNEAQELGLEIIGHMRKRMDEAIEKYHLNFSLLATPAEGLSGYFTRIDKKRYGVIEKITDRDYYTNSFHVPVYYPICAFDKIQKEAPYHALTNAGHISYIEMDGDPSNNLEAFEAVVRCMKENGIGYGSINHPVDRDPCCGYAGIIPGHVCPKCGRSDIEHRQVKDNIKRIKL